MSRSKRQDRAIQRVGDHLPSATVQTPQGPAIIQVIDMPSAIAAATPGGPAFGTSRPAGINILSAVLRRWWLVLLVAVVVGGSGVMIANRVIKPIYEVDAFVYYSTLSPSNGKVAIATDPSEIVRTHIELLTKPEMSLMAARSPELQQALPWIRSFDLEKEWDRGEVARRLRGACEAIQIKNTDLVQIRAEKPDGFVAAAIANAFADAFVEHCSNRLLGREGVRRKQMQQQLDEHDAMMKELIKARTDLMARNDVEMQKHAMVNMINQITEYQRLRNEADIKRIAAEAELEKFQRDKHDEGRLPSEMQLARKRRIDEEKQKDALLTGAVSVMVDSYAKYQLERGEGKTDQHPDVILARDAMRRAEEAVNRRETEITAAIDAKVIEEQKLILASTKEQAENNLRQNDQVVKRYEERIASMDAEARKVAVEQQKLEHVNDALGRVRKQYDDLWALLQGLNLEQNSLPDATILVAERAEVPAKPTDDKRVKVQAASLIGGLFLGIFLALLVDKFDKRLRNPRDIEPLMGAPMLGMIPHIGELKRAKGDMARGLIAEEFRLIRTQLLFGNTDKPCKSICITSPAPGDGKTSLAVNLAISLAKAGRRVLLLDADLRKPDIHRIFGVPAAPGLAELIQRTADPASAIRKTGIENLEVLAAGLPMCRPSELLSQKQMEELLGTLEEIYDHVVLDSAPLLPVSDTHVLISRVDGVICSFNAQVDSGTVKMIEEILRRANANVIGSVMNQVRYRESTSYQRGKSAYSSYYVSAAESPERRPVPQEAAMLHPEDDVKD